MRGVETVLFLVVVATVVATFANRLRVPAPSLLVVAGVAVGLLPAVPVVEVTPDVVSLVVLPPLLFAAGEELPWRDLRAVARPVAVLSVGLVAVSAAAVAAVAVAVTPLPVGMAFVLGAVLASTDPVAVTALARKLALPPRVQALIQAESLFNDATSLLLFRVALFLAVAGGAASWGRTLGEFGVLAGGGIAVGVLTAGGAYLIRRRTEDPVVETVVSLVTPYAGYVLAESVGGSGVTAVVVAAVILGTQAERLSSPRIRLQVDAVYRTVVFLLESVVFGLIGLQLPVLVRRLAETGPWWILQALAVGATLVVVRMVLVFVLSALRQRRGGQQVSWQAPAVISWAGARGVVPLAAALSLPVAEADGSALPYRDLVLLLTTAVIVLTLVVQGFTLAPLVQRTGIGLNPVDVHNEYRSARRRITEAGLRHLDVIADTESVATVVVDQLRHSWATRLDRIDADGEQTGDNPGAHAHRALRRELLDTEAAELTRLFEAGEITDGTRRRVLRQLDLEQARLDE